MSKEVNYVEPIGLSTFDSASLTSSYQAINGTGTPEDAKILRIVNDSTVPITISYDGTLDADVILSKTDVQYSFQANACDLLETTGVKYLRKGQQIFAKGSAGTGNIYVSGYR